MLVVIFARLTGVRVAGYKQKHNDYKSTAAVRRDVGFDLTWALARIKQRSLSTIEAHKTKRAGMSDTTIPDTTRSKRGRINQRRCS